jgi:hypothetical protein
MSANHTRHLIEGIEIHTLTDGSVAFSVAPELGARVVSIIDLAAGREWLDGWSPASGRRLWHPTDPGDFATGPGAGLDECLPTVLPCEVGGRPLGDHGELWNQAVPVTFDPVGPSLRCRWLLQSLPLAFDREISLAPGRLLFTYQLENLAAGPTPFQWAWHPLFTFEPGDELRFSPSPAACFEPDGTERPWPAIRPGCNLAKADLWGVTSQCAKVFVGPLASAHVRIQSLSGARIDLEWPIKWLPHAGLWITRGGWKGLHHWAVEPTNVPLDCLSDAVRRPEFERLVWLHPGEIRTWQITLSFGADRPGGPLAKPPGSRRAR